MCIGVSRALRHVVGTCWTGDGGTERSRTANTARNAATTIAATSHARADFLLIIDDTGDRARLDVRPAHLRNLAHGITARTTDAMATHAEHFAGSTVAARATARIDARGATVFTSASANPVGRMRIAAG